MPNKTKNGATTSNQAPSKLACSRTWPIAKTYLLCVLAVLFCGGVHVELGGSEPWVQWTGAVRHPRCAVCAARC